MATRRRFSREFKVETVKLVNDRGVSVSLKKAAAYFAKESMRNSTSLRNTEGLGQ